MIKLKNQKHHYVMWYKKYGISFMPSKINKPLNKKINDWVSHQLITKNQAKKIINYETNKSGRSWVLYGFSILGFTTIAIGVISLIAANWQLIPGDLKLLIDFLLLILVAFWVYSSWKQERFLMFEVSLAFFMLLCLASIGLISQVYHTGGQLYEALLLWSAITLGLALVSQKTFPPLIWSVGFFLSLSTAIFSSPTLQPVFQDAIPPIFMTLLLLAISLAMISTQFNLEPQTKALNIWVIIMGIFGLVMIEIYQFNAKTYTYSEDMPAFFIGYLLAILSILFILMDFEYKKIQKNILLLTLMFYLIPFHFSFFDIESQIAYAFSSIITLTTFAIFTASLQKRRLFQFFLILIGLRFFVLYCQEFGGLMTTGFILITSGIIIITMVIGWNKYHHRLTLWTERLVR